MKSLYIFFGILSLGSFKAIGAELITINSGCGGNIGKVCFYDDPVKGTIACKPMYNGTCPKEPCEDKSPLFLQQTISYENKFLSYTESKNILNIIRTFIESKGRLDSLEDVRKLKIHLGVDRYLSLKHFLEKGGKADSLNWKDFDAIAKVITKKENNENFTLKDTKQFAGQVQSTLKHIDKDEPLYKAVSEFVKLPLSTQRKILNDPQENLLPATAALVTAVVTVRVVETAVRAATTGDEKILEKYEMEVKDTDFDML